MGEKRKIGLLFNTETDFLELVALLVENGWSQSPGKNISKWDTRTCLVIEYTVGAEKPGRFGARNEFGIQPGEGISVFELSDLPSKMESLKVPKLLQDILEQVKTITE